MGPKSTITLPSEKKCSGLNQERDLHMSQAETVQNSSEQIHWEFDVRDIRRYTFSLEQALLCIMDSYLVKNILMDFVPINNFI